MKKVGLKKRLMAICIAMVMVLSTVPTSVFAGSAKNSNQVTFAGTENETPSNPLAGSNELSANGKVALSKTIVQEAEENAFDITIKVTTTEDIESLSKSQDAAVVFVFDVSGSMTSNTTRYNDKTVTRLVAAQAAGTKFVEQFVANAGEGARWFSLVSFDLYAKAELGFTELTSGNNVQTAKNRINGLSVNSNEQYTNIEAGLLLAKNILTDFEQNYPTVTNLYVVLLSDGDANRGVENTIAENVTSITEIRGTNTSVSTSSRVEDNLNGTTNRVNIPKVIKDNLGAELYSIAFASNVPILSTISTGGAGGVFLADSGTALFEKLEEIANLITQSAEAWIITDPMGENLVFDTAVNSVAEGFSTTDTDNYKYFNPNSKVFTWSVKNTLQAPEKTVKDGITTYTVSYRVKLDNQVEGFSLNTNYETNDTTGLTYLVAEEKNGEIARSTSGTLSFEANSNKLPTVQGYGGNLSIKKKIILTKQKQLTA